MKKSRLFLLLFLFLQTQGYAQQVLPAISVSSLNEKIIVSWRNLYSISVANISIQRSYDSSKNFTTIGSVLTPQNKENGYADINPPYNKMWYRAFISFDGGSYILSPAVRPSKFGTGSNGDSAVSLVNPLLDSLLQVPPAPAIGDANVTSKRIFIAKDYSVVINLPDAASRKYQVKFFDELENMIFELTKLKDDYLILDKVNFMKVGWYRFEIYDAGMLIEKNRFYVSPELKGSLPDLHKTFNRQ